MFPRDPNGTPRSDAVRRALSDMNATAARDRQESVTKAFQRYLNSGDFHRALTDTRVHGVLYRRRVDPTNHIH